MGCAPSSQSAEYASLGHHGHREVSKINKSPDDQELYGNTHEKRRKSSSSSSSSDSEDERINTQNVEDNDGNINPPPLPVLIYHDRMTGDIEGTLPPPDINHHNEEKQNKLQPVVSLPVPKDDKHEDMKPTTSSDKRPNPPPPVNDMQPIPTPQVNDKHPTPPGPVNDKQPIPPPHVNDKQPSPPVLVNNKQTMPTPNVSDKHPTPPGPVNDKQPIPPPHVNDKHPTPPGPVNDKQPIPPPHLNDKHPTPPGPANDKQPIPPPHVNDKHPTPPGPVNDKHPIPPPHVNDKHPTPPGPVNDKQPIPPPLVNDKHPTPPGPVNDKQPIPPPNVNDKHPTPPGPVNDKQQIPPPHVNDKHPTPPGPGNDKHPIPPPHVNDKHPTPPGPVNDKQPIPAPHVNDKHPTPPGAVNDKQPIPAPHVNDKHPTPPGPVNDKQPIPPPHVNDKHPTPPAPVNDKQPVPTPHVEDGKPASKPKVLLQPVQPPTQLQKETERKTSTPAANLSSSTPSLPAAQSTNSTPAPQDLGQQGYLPADIGTFERNVDFRTVGKPFSISTRPSPNDNGLYTDREFTAEVAVPRVKGMGWKRPQEICDKPTLFSEGTTRFDIGQGQVGTCWFLSMVASIADNPKLLQRVVPASEYKIGTKEYDGVFHCRFWRFGVWRDIFIDDKLPVTPNGQMYGAHSNTDKNEMWVSLLEKAFAKMYDSYDEVTGGRVADAYMNLTSGVGETIKFDDKQLSPSQLFQRLKNAFQSETTMVGCVCPDRSNNIHGLVGGHAYSMNGTYEVNGTMLVRIRNPWGRTEWTGPWSDGSKEMSTVGKSIPHANKDDGEFYMDIKDFLKYFEQCSICNLTPDVDMDGRADTLQYVMGIYGNWRKGKAGGFANKLQNPKYCITVPDKGMDKDGNVPLVVQIIQRTSTRLKDKVAIRCDLYRVLYEDSNMVVLDELGDKNNMYLIDFSVSYRFSVKPGKYVAIPSTMDSGIEKEFLIRVFTSAPALNPFEIGDHTKVVSGKGPELEVQGHTLTLDQIQCIPGCFVKGRTAGGQISCPTFATNPQYFMTVKAAQNIKVEVMQPEIKNKFPLGIKLFKADKGKFPADYAFLTTNYNSAIKDLSGDDGPFSYGESVDCGYNVQSGTYILVIHANTTSDENDFAVAVYSEQPVKMEPAHL